MKALGLTPPEREAFVRKIVVQFCSVTISDQGLQDIDGIKRDLERLQQATNEVDLAALFLDTVTGGKYGKRGT
jgi:hypothetical protein